MARGIAVKPGKVVNGNIDRNIGAMHPMVTGEQPASSADAARAGPVVRAVLVVSGDPVVQGA